MSFPPGDSQSAPAVPARLLLAVDVGLRYGLAVYGGDGRLCWYRSCRLPNRGLLKRASWSLLRELDGLEYLVLEGGGPLADIWARHGERLGARVLPLAAHTWRQVLLFRREQRTGGQAKAVAGRLAREVIAWSGAARPTSLRHDAAEAILAGLWGVLRVGWLESSPAIRHG